MPFLLKTEPDKYSFDDLLRDGETIWDGIKNPQALGSLRSMKKGEKLVIYHSNTGKAAVGTATVLSVDAADPKNPQVRIKPGKRLKSEKSLASMREAPVFENSLLFRQFRLSVVPLSAEQYDWLLQPLPVDRNHPATGISPPMSTQNSSETFRLGNDLSVNRLGYGTMRLVGEGAWGEPQAGREAARTLLRRAVDLGINFFDTADAYGPHIAEDLLAEALHPYPSGLVIATKGGLTRTGPAKAKPLGRPDYLVQSVELSLRRLKLERIDLYQLHRIDPTVPVEETLGALKELQTQGKIRHIGLSEVTPEEIERAEKTVPIVSVQNKYNLTERKSEATLKFCEERGIAFLPWYPLAAGKLAHAGSAVQEFATQQKLSLNQLSLAWLLQRSPVMLPIPGTSSIEHLEQNVAAAKLSLPEDVWSDFDLILDTQAS